MQKIMKNKGITLVALVVTIIIMLILAGVTLNIALGDNGLFKMARNSVKAYEESAQKEEGELDNILEDMNHILPEDAGKEVEVPKKEKDKWDLAKVTPTADGKGNTIPVPKGFYYAGGNIDTGFVISSTSGDDLNNSKGGDQFVWIPCTVTQYTDAIDDVIDNNWSYNSAYRNNGDTGGVQKSEGTGDGKAWRDYYNEKDSEILNATYTDDNQLPTLEWEKVNQNTVATESIEKYKGFYIARFEAGVPSDATFYRNIGSSDLKYIISGRGMIGHTAVIKDYKPASKKGTQVWTYITQPNSKRMAENMYQGDANVGSYLIDSGAWNVICNKFNDILGTSKEKEDQGKTIKNSTAWGNYNNNITTDYTKIIGLWAKHVKVGTGWGVAAQYETRQLTQEDRVIGQTFIELSTGASEDFKLYNIYDMAGNVWEWTTAHNVIKKSEDNNEQMFVINRGAGSNNSGDYGVVRAHGDRSLGSYANDIGFRVVLYIK